MHRSVLQDEDYIDFSGENTVEVIAIGGVKEGVESGDEKAAQYEVEVAGEKIKRLVAWPNLTLEQIEALNASKAGTYNDTGSVPHLTIVDPHTLEELDELPGGGHGTKHIMELIEKNVKKLQKEHGKGLKRKDLKKVRKELADALDDAAKGEVRKALQTLDKVEKKQDDWPEFLKGESQAARSQVLAAGEKMVAEAEALVEDDPKEASRLLGRIKSRLARTPLAEKVDELLAALKSKASTAAE